MTVRFIVFEGLDGSGKSTQAKLLAERLQAEGETVVLTSEPTNSSIGLFLRELLRLPDGGGYSPSVMSMLFAADRLQHSEELIIPALGRGDWVICDRYYHSSFAYNTVIQSGELFGDKWVEGINGRAQTPRVVFFIDTGIDECLSRLKKRGNLREFYEQRGKLEYALHGYQATLLKKEESLRNPHHTINVNGSLTVEGMSDYIWDLVRPVASHSGNFDLLTNVVPEARVQVYTAFSLQLKLLLDAHPFLKVEVSTAPQLHPSYFVIKRIERLIVDIRNFLEKLNISCEVPILDSRGKVRTARTKYE